LSLLPSTHSSGDSSSRIDSNQGSELWHLTQVLGYLILLRI